MELELQQKKWDKEVRERKARLEMDFADANRCTNLNTSTHSMLDQLSTFKCIPSLLFEKKTKSRSKQSSSSLEDSEELSS